MALFYAAIGRNSFSLLRFPFFIHVQVFSFEISLVCRLKYPYNCLFFHFCFQVIVVLLICVMSALFLKAVVSLSSFFFMWSSSRRIDTSTPLSVLASPLPPFYYIYSQSSVGCKVLCIFICFLVS